FLLNHARHPYILNNLKKKLTDQGDNVYIGSRNLDKPHLAEIVQELGWDTFLIRPMISNSPFAIVSYIIQQIIQINKVIRKNKIDRIISSDLNIASIAAKRNRINTVGWIDTEHVTWQVKIAFYSSDVLIAPEFAKFDQYKRIVFKSIIDSAYLHPSIFKYNPEIVENLRLLENGRPILYRLTNFTALHDKKIKSRDWEYDLIREIAKNHPIILVSEGKVPKDLQKYQKNFKITDFHHILSQCKLYIGSGGSTATEANLLGVPAIYSNPLNAGIFEEFQKRFGLFHNHRITKQLILKSMNYFLSMKKSEINLRYKKILNYCEDINPLLYRLATDDIEILKLEARK
ncbi:hypothetical protein LCGC14_1814170, partial [marine sediment metagenome]